MMQTMSRFVDLVIHLLTLAGSLGILAMMAQVVADVFARGLFGTPLPATNEIVSHYWMVLIAFLPLGFVERRGGMVSVEVLEAILPEAGLRVTDFLVTLLATLIYVILAWTTWYVALAKFETGAFIIVLNERLPLWQSYFLVPVGFAFAALATGFRGVEILAGRQHESPDPGMIE